MSTHIITSERNPETAVRMTCFPVAARCVTPHTGSLVLSRTHTFNAEKPSLRLYLAAFPTMSNSINLFTCRARRTHSVTMLLSRPTRGTALSTRRSKTERNSSGRSLLQLHCEQFALRRRSKAKSASKCRFLKAENAASTAQELL